MILESCQSSKVKSLPKKLSFSRTRSPAMNGLSSLCVTSCLLISLTQIGRSVMEPPWVYEKPFACTALALAANLARQEALTICSTGSGLMIWHVVYFVCSCSIALEITYQTLSLRQSGRQWARLLVPSFLMCLTELQFQYTASYADSLCKMIST